MDVDCEYIRASDGVLEVESEDWQVAFDMYYEGKLSYVKRGGSYECEMVLDLRKGGEVRMTTTLSVHHESRPGEVKVVVRACRCQD